MIGLFVSLLFNSRFAVYFGLTIVSGFVVFAGQVRWMLGHRVAKPVGARPIDFGLLHAAGAGLSLVGAAAIGLALLTRPASPLMLRAAAAYGVLGLVGFLAQMVVAMETRLLPMVTWFWEYAGSGYRVAPPSPHAMRDRSWQVIVFTGWTLGVPALALGMFFESAALVGAGAWALFVGVVIAALDNVLVVFPGIGAARRITRTGPAHQPADARAQSS